MVEVRSDENELLELFCDTEGEQCEYVFELEVVLGGGGLVVEVDEHELFLGPG